MKKLWEVLKPIVTSKTVIAIIAGAIVQAGIHFKIIPDTAVTQAIAYVTDAIAVLFRVVATDNINPADPKTELKK